ncbi:hypothetical protein [Halomarina oriensis]|uniref:Uncharacterized protein n=1 Tax=Halomarina oriensis TaxID=671145 RepID=A0A6B0GJS2_9EURY|nr:hypothetical protein [Halomarina oriensis]MWG33649.1 hypothetical protein [Halomarina oriensis]
MSRHPRFDGWTDSRTPCDSQSLVATFALAAFVPVAFWAMEFPTTAALVGAFLVALALSARYAVSAAAHRMDGRTAAIRVPGLDTQVEVRLAARPNR